ncbi:MAG: hypothetical protein H0U53_06495 [Actinobacteria bacterium]|nr:hypothetical protein [Actinomycetota bacterium]
MPEEEKDQPAASKVDGYAPKYPEPPEATEVEPETSSSTKGAGTAEWECLTCGRRFDEDLARCPDDGAPLRKTGPAAVPVGQRHIDDENREPISNPASSPDQTPEGYGKAGSHSEEPVGGSLQGERPATGE